MIDFFSIAYFQIFGISFVIWLGSIAFIFLILTGLVPMLSKNTKIKINFKWHNRLAILTFIFATMHVVLTLLAKL